MYIRRRIREELTQTVQSGYAHKIPPDYEAEITLPRDPTHGDYATNFPLKAAKHLGAKPLQVAEELAGSLAGHPLFLKAVPAAPGFVNLFLSQEFLSRQIRAIGGTEDFFSHYRVEHPLKVNVEFVSANPTGPLTVGHGRNACLGDSIGRILSAVGHEVSREYYFNNAGRQMKILGESLRARYLEAAGEPVEFPEEGYIGEYLAEIGREIFRRDGKSITSAEAVFFQKEAEKNIFEIIRTTLSRMSVTFDQYFNEDRLYENGAVTSVLERLKQKDLAYESEGAVWFRGESQKLPKDPVLVKKSGEPTYRLPDVAYHIDKLGRGFDRIIDVLGADHIDEHREVIAILRALGYDPDPIRGIIYQFVTLVRDGKPVKMSTRKAEYITLDELLDEVGPDVARFFFLSRKADTHLEFDLELAKKESQENPVYYIQYAHARLAGIFRTAAEQGFSAEDIQKAEIDLKHSEAEILAKKILSFGDVLEGCVSDLEITALLWYLRELAEAFHRFYTEVRVVDGADREGSLSRLKLCQVVQKILKTTLTTVGIQAPDRM